MNSPIRLTPFTPPVRALSRVPAMSSSAGFFMALLLLALASVAQAQTPAGLEVFADGLETLSGRFEQVTVDGLGQVVDEASGSFYYQRPDRFRWDYGQPFAQQIVADGQQLWHYDEALEQVTVREQPPAEESPMLVLMRPELLEHFYRIVSSTPERLEFEPLEDHSEVVRGRLYLDVQGWPRRLELDDEFNQRTRFNLLDLVRNPELDPALFRFIVPEGADVLDGF